MNNLDYLVFDQEVTADSVRSLINDLLVPWAPRGVYVDSPGGTFWHFEIFGPLIDELDIDTLGGNVESAAILLYLLGTRRFALPDATFFFHEVGAHMILPGRRVTLCDLDGAIGLQRVLFGRSSRLLREWREGIHDSQQWFVDFVHRRTGMSPTLILYLMRNEVRLNAREAEQHGIVHQVLPPNAFLIT